MVKLLNRDKDDKTEVKTTLRIPKGILKRLKLNAVSKDIPMSNIILKLITEYLNKEEGKK